MANAMHLTRGSRFLLKGTIFVIFGAALFSIFSFSYQRFRKQTGGDDVDVEKRTIGDGDDDGVYDPVDDKHKLSWPGNEWQKQTTGRTKCYVNKMDPQKKYCLPDFVTIETNGVNAYILHNMLGHCEYIKAAKTDYFSNFANMEDVEQDELYTYLGKFRKFSNEIIDAGEENEKIIGDYGHYGARGYIYNPESDLLPVPYLTPLNLLRHLNPELKVINMIRNPLNAIYVAYCQADYPLEEFTAEVHKSLDAFDKCKTGPGFVPCMKNMTLHDRDIYKVDITSLIQSFWIREMSKVVDAKDYLFVLYENLVKPATQRETLQTILTFLDVDCDPDDLIARHNDGSGGSDGTGADGDIGLPPPPKCNPADMEDEAKVTLQNYFASYNLILYDEFGLGKFDGWSYP